MKTDAMCRHPRIARTIGWPYYGNYHRPLRAGEAPCDAHAREAELSHEASQPQVIEARKEADCGESAQQPQPLERPMPEWPSMPEWRPIPECARPLPPAARRACEHPQDDSGRYGFGGVHSVWWGALRNHFLNRRPGTPINHSRTIGPNPIAMREYLEPLLLCTAVFVFGIGCSSPYVAQTPPPSAYRPVPLVSPVPDQPLKAKVEIISEPAGARIEVNDNYVGDAPITVEIPQKQRLLHTGDRDSSIANRSRRLRPVQVLPVYTSNKLWQRLWNRSKRRPNSLADPFRYAFRSVKARAAIEINSKLTQVYQRVVFPPGPPRTSQTEPAVNTARRLEHSAQEKVALPVQVSFGK